MTVADLENFGGGDDKIYEHKFVYNLKIFDVYD